MAAISDRSDDRPRGGEARDRGAPLTGRTLLLFAGMVLTGSLALGLVTSAIASLVVPSNQIGVRPYLVSSLPAVLMLFIAILPALWCRWFWRQLFPSVERPRRRRLPERRRKAAAAAATRAVVPKAGPRPVPTPPDPTVTERATADLVKRREERRRLAERRRLDEQRREGQRRLEEQRRREEHERRREEHRRRAEEESRRAEARREAERRRRAEALERPRVLPTEAKATPLAELRLPRRVDSTLARAGIETIEQLTSRTQAELLEVRGIGAKSLEDIRAALDRAGRALRYPRRVSRIG